MEKILHPDERLCSEESIPWYEIFVNLQKSLLPILVRVSKSQPLILAQAQIIKFYLSMKSAHVPW